MHGNEYICECEHNLIYFNFTITVVVFRGLRSQSLSKIAFHIVFSFCGIPGSVVYDMLHIPTLHSFRDVREFLHTSSLVIHWYHISLACFSLVGLLENYYL